MRLGVYADLVYRRHGDSLSADRAFVHFLGALAERVEELVVFGRLDPAPGPGLHRLAGGGIRLVPLPYYPRLGAAAVARAFPESCRRFAAALEDVDAIWLFGPHPLALAFALLARRRKKTVFLGVRQDYVQYVRHRASRPQRLWVLPVSRLLESSFRRLARRTPTVVAGDELLRRYARRGGDVLAIQFSLVRSADVVSSEEALARRWDADLRVLSVGRLDPEKNPLLLPEILARLRARDAHWHLVVVGDGSLAASLARRARELGVSDAIDLQGELPLGERLWSEYRSSHAFLHVSLTEGAPQVLTEARAAGLPIVATRVGGVGPSGESERWGLLVPIADAASAARALERLRDDEPLRRGLITTGLERALGETMDIQLDRLEAFFASHLGPKKE